MKPILNGLLFFTFIYLLSDFFVSYHSFGLFSEQVKTTLFGNMDEFIDPITKDTFLEYIHSQIFFMMMILLTLSAVFARLCSKKSYMLFFINILMISALLSLFSLGLSFFFAPALINLYVLSYFTWHSMALSMILISLWNLNLAKSV